MESSIALMVSGYLITRIGILAVIGYVVYRVLRSTSGNVGIQPTLAPARTSNNSRQFSR
jgi:hypothetical protein